MEEKKYPIPEETTDLIDKSIALGKMRDVLAGKPFKFKKAVKCATDSEKLKRKFWGKVAELYPELVGNRLTIGDGNTYVMIYKEEK